MPSIAPSKRYAVDVDCPINDAPNSVPKDFAMRQFQGIGSQSSTGPEFDFHHLHQVS